MTNHKQERAQRIVDATMELTLRPKREDRARVIAAALRETINQLQQSPGVIMCYDLLELCEELEALDELAQENPQVPFLPYNDFVNKQPY